MQTPDSKCRTPEINRGGLRCSLLPVMARVSSHGRRAPGKQGRARLLQYCFKHCTEAEGSRRSAAARLLNFPARRTMPRAVGIPIRHRTRSAHYPANPDSLGTPGWPSWREARSYVRSCAGSPAKGGSGAKHLRGNTDCRAKAASQTSRPPDGWARETGPDGHVAANGPARAS